MLNKKETTHSLLNMTNYNAGVVSHSFQLNKRKLLVGRAPHCDIQIDHPQISYYHALVTLEENGATIIDLESDNGVKINNKTTTRGFFNNGDVIQLGTLEFHIGEELIEASKNIEIIQNHDKDIEIIERKDEDEINHQLPPKEGLVIIDGEYCDIIFDDNGTTIDHIPAFISGVNSDDYIDPSDDEIEHQEIVKDSNKESIEVTFLVGGHIISIDYLPIKNKTYFISSKAKTSNTVHLPLLDHDDKTEFIKVKNGMIDLMPLDDMKRRHLGDQNFLDAKQSLNLNNDEIYSYEKESMQVLIRTSDHPPSLKTAPFFGRDKDIQKEMAKAFSLFLAFFIVLMFIDTTVTPPPKKIAVVYRPAIKAPNTAEKSKQNADKQNKDKGTKKTEQEPKPTKMAKKAVNKKVKKKVAKTKPAPAKKAAPAPKTVKTKAKAPVKTYQFKMNTKLNSFLNTKKSVTVSNSQSAGKTGKTSLKTVSTTGDTGLTSAQSANIGTLGKDFAGNYDSSTGAKGLASKSGIDTAYVAPKTVVLGSMDPELLRKILREYLPQFRHCYQKELERNDSAKGVIDLNFRILGNGKVGNINIQAKGGGFSRAGKGCMANVLKLIDFPKPKGGGVVDIRQPLNFQSKKEKY